MKNITELIGHDGVTTLTREAFSSGAKPSEFDLKRQDLTPKRQELDLKRQELIPKRQELGLPIWTDRNQITDNEWKSLETIALPVKEHGKVSTDTMHDVIRPQQSNR